jgi:hypothetical protein
MVPWPGWSKESRVRKISLQLANVVFRYRRRLFGLAVIFLPGCTLTKGGPDIAKSVWLFQPSADLVSDSAYVPQVCPQNDSPDALRPFINTAPKTANAQAANIRLCSEALRQLIDIRWKEYADSVFSANNTGNSLMDITKLGLTGAATAITGPTAQVLSGIATFLGGVQATVNQDYLYNKSIQLILLQRKTDRATWADTINKHLIANSYGNMYEAANDLWQYAAAGSWTNALTSMEANAGAATAACTAQIQSPYPALST